MPGAPAGAADGAGSDAGGGEGWLTSFARLTRAVRTRVSFLVPVSMAVSLGAAVWWTAQAGGVPAAVGVTSPSAETLVDSAAKDSEEPSLLSLPPFLAPAAPEASIRRRIRLRTDVPSRPRLTVVRYTVEPGDTLFGIAERFGLAPETLLWGNFEALQDNPHGLRPGQELNILPVDGTYYIWNEGDRLEAVAAFFGVEPQAIFDWPGNALVHAAEGSAPAIEAGTPLVVPGGKRALVTWQAPRITRRNPAAARYAGPGACGSVVDGPNGEGVFIWPTVGRALSGYGYSSLHPGIDIGGSTGNAIYASATGVVVYAGWNDYGYGNMVVIDHGDGWQTLYAHMSRVGVACGQSVFQGNVIGGVGSTGNSSGSHLHFEMENDLFGKVNPYNFVSP